MSIYAVRRHTVKYGGEPEFTTLDEDVEHDKVLHVAKLVGMDIEYNQNVVELWESLPGGHNCCRSSIRTQSRSLFVQEVDDEGEDE